MSTYGKAAPVYETCGSCGKKFYIPNKDAWVYHRYAYRKSRENGHIWFCGWNCMRAWEKKNPIGRRSTWYDIPEDDY